MSIFGMSKLSGILEREKRIVANGESVKATSDSPISISIPSRILKSRTIGIVSKLKFFWGARISREMMEDVLYTYESTINNPSASRTKIDIKELDALKSMALKLGIGAIGFTKVPRIAIFKEKAILFPYAIVALMEMDRIAISKAPSRDTQEEVMGTYFRLGKAINQLSDYLRKSGFQVQGGHPLGGSSLYPLLAKEAGLGFLGKHGIIISPDFGPRFRIGAIYTNVENLPLDGRSNHSRITDFCESCKRCIRKCPAGAILEKPERSASGLQKHIDIDKCLQLFVDKHSCSVCIKECTFNNDEYHKIQQRFLSNARSGGYNEP